MITDLDLEFYLLLQKIFNCNVTGVEIDSLAIKNAIYNNSLNGVEIKYLLPRDLIFQKKYDIVISNILASILINLSKDFKNLH